MWTSGSGKMRIWQTQDLRIWRYVDLGNCISWEKDLVELILKTFLNSNFEGLNPPIVSPFGHINFDLSYLVVQNWLCDRSGCWNPNPGHDILITEPESSVICASEVGSNQS